MDTEQQIRLNFLDEAEEYFDSMETNLLGLADTAVDIQKIDIILRAAHSIKGGAAMMGFGNLSQVAHRLEDFLKILRVRYASEVISAEVETLLLQSVDYLRDFAKLNRQNEASGIESGNLESSETNDQIQSIFDRLQQQLGELQEEDEDALMSSQDGDIDPALLIFEEGVESVLDTFESRLKAVGIDELSQEIASTSQELIGFGYMANLEPFIQLCNSIEEQAFNLSSTEISSFASKALKAWKRSHALVLRGNLEKLPASIDSGSLSSTDSKSTQSSPELFDSSILENSSAFEFFEEESNLDINGFDAAFSEPAFGEPAFGEAAFGEPAFGESDQSGDEINFDNLQSAFAETNLEPELGKDEPQTIPEAESLIPSEILDSSNSDVSQAVLSSEFGEVEQSEVDNEAEFVIPQDAAEQLSDVNLDALQSVFDDSELPEANPNFEEDLVFDQFVRSISATLQPGTADKQKQEKSKSNKNPVQIGSANKAEK